MRVLMTADAVGGVWTYALALTQALRPCGVQVVIATMGRAPSAEQRANAESAGVAALYESEFHLEWMADPWEDVAAAGAWLLELARSEEVDLVHLNGYAHAALAWDIPVLVGAHSCVLSWWRAVHDRSAPGEWDRYRRAVRAGLDAADMVVAPTRNMLSMLEAEHGEIPRACVVHNGLPGSSSSASLKQAVVLAAGRFWDEGKNLGILESVAPLVSWPVCVAGDCYFAGERKSPTRVEHLGVLSTSDLRAWQHRAAIAVHPALYEPFGYGPLEAAQAGCALVLADVPSLRELWDGAALFAPPREPKRMALAINHVIADADLRAALATRARRRARAFTAEAMSAQFHSVYRGLAVKARSEVSCIS